MSCKKKTHGVKCMLASSSEVFPRICSLSSCTMEGGMMFITKCVMAMNKIYVYMQKRERERERENERAHKHKLWM